MADITPGSDTISPAFPAREDFDYVDLLFPVRGGSIPRDHGYSLYAALCRVVPSLHRSRDIGVFAIRGVASPNSGLALTDRSLLRIRVSAKHLPGLLPLAGKGLDVDGHRLRVGVPRVQSLTPAAALASRLVLIKIAHAQGRGGVTTELFLNAARKQLTALSIAAEPVIPLVQSGPHAGEPRRRVIRVKAQTHAGYAMHVEGLSAEESHRLQAHGIGGRRVMGCGLFGPMGTRRSARMTW